MKARLGRVTRLRHRSSQRNQALRPVRTSELDDRARIKVQGE